jgi:ferredoxin-nitrite reductase
MEALSTAFNERNKKQNKIEKLKETKEASSVIDNLENISKKGYEALADEDSKYFLKCYGIYDKKDDFMIRVRVPAGRLSYSQAVEIGNIAFQYGEDYIDVTTRQQIELRYIKIEHLYSVIKRLSNVGITTYQTGVDNLRNIITDPLDGISYDNIIDTFPIITKLQDIFLKNDKYISVLPRKFNTAILGSITNSCNIFGHDCCFALANKDGEYGFNVYLGGKVGVQAVKSNIFVTIDSIELFFTTLLDLFKKFGFRDNRNKNRLVDLIKAVGMDIFIKALKQKSNYEFQTFGTNLVSSKGSIIGHKISQKDSQFAYKIIIPSGITSGSDLIKLSKCSSKYGSGDLRLSYDQNIYIINIKKENFKDLLEDEIVLKYIKYQNIYFSDMIACAGTKTCSFAVIPNKKDAIEMADYLNKEVPLDSGKIRMNWSACVKGCGIHGIADIGFEGCIAKDKNNKRVDGVHILLGGKITHHSKEGFKFMKSVPISRAKYYIKYLLQAYSSLKLDEEYFEDFQSRVLEQYSHQCLIFYCMINYILEINNLDSLNLKDKINSGKNESFEIFNFGCMLYFALTSKARYGQIIDFIPTLDNKIKENSISKINQKVPIILSEIIYKMTIFDKTKRYQVFSEIIEQIKDI